MVPILEDLPRPFFAFLITLGLHHPFEAFPQRHKVLDVGELRDAPLGNYLHAMHYVDRALATFVAELEKRGMLSDTVVAFYGDHEAGFGLDRRMLALAGDTTSDQSALFRLRRVPFLVLAPGVSADADVAVVGGQVDIAPTLLHLLGVARPVSFLGGPLAPGRAVPAVLPGGSAASLDRLFVARGYGIPDSGLCFNFPGPGSRPLAECGALKQAAAEEFLAAHTVVEHDLAATLAASRR